MKLTIILVAALVALMAVRNLWLALDNRKTRLQLNDYRRELDSREIELNRREEAVEIALEDMKKQSEELAMESEDCRQVKASYVVSESDEYRYSNEKLMANGIRKHLAATLADSLIREFGAPEEGLTTEGRKIFTYNFMAKRIL